MNTKNHLKQSFSQYFLAYLPSLLWAGLIFILSSQTVLPGFDLSLIDYVFKKTAHMFVYAVLYYLLFKAYQRSHPDKKNKPENYYWPLLIAFIYAISDELHQSTVDGRFGNVKDVAYDSLGMLSVLLHQQKLL